MNLGECYLSLSLCVFIVKVSCLTRHSAWSDRDLLAVQYTIGDPTPPSGFMNSSVNRRGSTSSIPCRKLKYAFWIQMGEILKTHPLGPNYQKVM